MYDEYHDHSARSWAPAENCSHNTMVKSDTCSARCACFSLIDAQTLTAAALSCLPQSDMYRAKEMMAHFYDMSHIQYSICFQDEIVRIRLIRHPRFDS